MTNKKAAAILEIFIILVIIVLTSAGVLFLVKYGILEVKAESEQQPILNAEFIPYAREGSIAINEFSFCAFVDEQYKCFEPREQFTIGDDAYFRFVVETTPYYGEVMIIENYRIVSAAGKEMLNVDLKKNYHYDVYSEEETESIMFKDYFTVGKGIPNGQYTLELRIENPLLNKKTTVTKNFIVE